MKICVYGAGAIGGYVAVKLAQKGHAVSVVARGEQLKAIQAKGLTLQQAGTRYHARVTASAEAAALGPQDYVFVSVKAPALPAVAGRLGPLLGPDTRVITAMNGLPWWIFQGFGAKPGLPIASVDPDGALLRAIPAERAIGCVLHIACSVPEPGLIVHNNQNRFMLGEPSGLATQRLTALVGAFKDAGMEATLHTDIQKQYWIKLLGNMTYAPVSILTQSTNDALCRDEGVRDVFRAMIAEANAVGAAFGLVSDMPVEERIDLGGSLIGFRTSMLQDIDKGRPVELDSIVGVLREMGRIAGLATPVIDTVFALAARRSAAAGLYGPRG